MTFAFYNLVRNEKPYLSFGISVKNEVRYKDVFYFLNFVELENYLNDYIEQVDAIINIADLLYGRKEKDYE